MELSDPCELFELDSRQLLAHESEARSPIVTPPKFPAVRRDLALVVDRELPVAQVLRTIAELNAPMLEKVEVFDVYVGAPIASDKKSVALACRYRSNDRTLTDEEVNRTHAALVEESRRRLGAELRQ